MLTKTARDTLLSLYDVRDSENADRSLPGYDRDHADRATRLLLLVADSLELSRGREDELEVMGLLHDLGRVGMDPVLFGRIFAIAQANGLPVRPTSLRAAYPSIPTGEVAAFYIALLRPRLEAEGIAMDGRVIDHIHMRMDFRRRFREQLAASQPVLDSLGVTFHLWMQKIALYYYYPEEMEGQPADVRLLGMAQVACENFEALNNARRGRDYYGRRQERLEKVFAVLAEFVKTGLVAPQVITCLKTLAATGALTGITRESRGLSLQADLPQEDLTYLGSLATGLPA